VGWGSVGSTGLPEALGDVLQIQFFGLHHTDKVWDVQGEKAANFDERQLSVFVKHAHQLPSILGNNSGFRWLGEQRYGCADATEFTPDAFYSKSQTKHQNQIKFVLQTKQHSVALTHFVEKVLSWANLRIPLNRCIVSIENSTYTLKIAVEDNEIFLGLISFPEYSSQVKIGDSILVLLEKRWARLYLNKGTPYVLQRTKFIRRHRKARLRTLNIERRPNLLVSLSNSCTDPGSRSKAIPRETSSWVLATGFSNHFSSACIVWGAGRGHSFRACSERS
jgi:hypothetical protein